MTPAELIRALDPGEQEDFGGATHALVEDFRADFPATDGERGNNTIRQALEAVLPGGVLERIQLDSEHSALYAYGTLEDLQFVLNGLQELKAMGYGQVVVLPPRLTIGQRAAKDRIQDLLAAMVVQGHDPDDIKVGLQALGYG